MQRCVHFVFFYTDFTRSLTHISLCSLVALSFSFFIFVCFIHCSRLSFHVWWWQKIFEKGLQEKNALPKEINNATKQAFSSEIQLKGVFPNPSWRAGAFFLHRFLYLVLLHMKWGLFFFAVRDSHPTKSKCVFFLVLWRNAPWITSFPSRRQILKFPRCYILAASWVFDWLSLRLISPSHVNRHSAHFRVLMCSISLFRIVFFLFREPCLFWSAISSRQTLWYLHLQEYGNVTPADKQATPLFLCFQSTATLVCSWSGKCQISSKTTQLYTNKQRPSPISVRHD